LSTNPTAATDGNVACYSGLAADNDVVFEHAGSGYAHLPCDNAVRTNPYVVPNLAEVVEFAAVSNDRFAHDRAVNAGARAQFHTISNANAAKVWNFGPSQCPWMGWYKTKSVGTKDHIGMNDAVFSHNGSRVENYTRIDNASRTDDYVFSKLSSGRNFGTSIHSFWAVG
jgi:hypothetical protein